jgi:formylmethanofuran--tetrahydromethanopterin N-formyltransferase
MTGFATSVIGCGCEAGIERTLAPAETPDGRPGVAVLVFAASSADLAKQVPLRVGQSVLTCPGTAVYSGLAAEEQVDVGAGLRYFGDGHQIAKRLDGVRYWRIPVMDGEFLCVERAGMVRAIGGGNFLLLGMTRAAARRAAERAVQAMRALPNIVLPFPGGAVRSGSKVGSKYKGLVASTNDAWCPTLRAASNTALPPNVESVLEIVIDGLTEGDVAKAMRAGIRAACIPDSGLVRIDAGNYGGKLGKFRFRLREVMG